jgi:hypothetical protein
MLDFQFQILSRGVGNNSFNNLAPKYGDCHWNFDRRWYVSDDTAVLLILFVFHVFRPPYWIGRFRSPAIYQQCLWSIPLNSKWFGNGDETTSLGVIYPPAAGIRVKWDIRTTETPFWACCTTTLYISFIRNKKVQQIQKCKKSYRLQTVKVNCTLQTQLRHNNNTDKP